MRYKLTIYFVIMLTLNGLTQSRQGFVPVDNGKIFYEKKGNGPAVMFLHGIALDHRMWNDQVDYFSKYFTCISMDLRGFGKSSVPSDSPYNFHDDINILLDSLGIKEPVVLVALSMGGRAAVNFSLAYPNRTRALVLADVAIDGYSFKNFKLDPVYELAKQKGTDSANKMFLNYPIFESARNDSGTYKRLETMIMSYSGWHWTHKNPIKGLSPPAIQQLNKIQVPVLIITGENDVWDFQEIAKILHSNIKRSLIKLIPNCGHMCNMEKPNEFNKLISDFLAATKIQ